MIGMLPIDLDMDMLRCFLEVAETESFTRTGKHIGLTQYTASVNIRRLEGRLRAHLLGRTSKRLSSTAEGDVLLDDARRMLAVYDEAVSRLTTPKASGKVRIGLTGRSIASDQAAVQAGMGLPILPKGALKEGLRKARSNLDLPELPMTMLALITDEQTKNDARVVFIGYLKAELNSLDQAIIVQPCQGPLLGFRIAHPRIA